MVVGVGKAAAAMAQAVEEHWLGPLDGVVVVPEGAALATENSARTRGRYMGAVRQVY